MIEKVKVRSMVEVEFVFKAGVEVREILYYKMLEEGYILLPSPNIVLFCSRDCVWYLAIEPCWAEIKKTSSYRVTTFP